MRAHRLTRCKVIALGFPARHCPRLSGSRVEQDIVCDLQKPMEKAGGKVQRCNVRVMIDSW